MRPRTVSRNINSGYFALLTPQCALVWRRCPALHNHRHIQSPTRAESLDHIMEVTRNLLCVIERGENELALANSTALLNLVGHTVITWLWLRQALTAVEKLGSASAKDRELYQGKLQTCAYLFRWELLNTEHWFELLNNLDATTPEMQNAWF